MDGLNLESRASGRMGLLGGNKIMAEQETQLEKIIKSIGGLYSKEEQDFIRTALVDRVDIFVLIRNFFLQAPLTEQEREAIKEFASVKWLPIIKRVFYPQIDFTRPLGQVRDLWSYMKTSDRQVEEAAIEIEARQILVDYLAQRFEVLESGKEVETHIQLVNLVPHKHKTPYQNLVDVTGRNLIMAGVEGSTSQLLVFANSIETTEEKIAERQRKDSSK